VIYGEEAVELSFQKGLWISDSPDTPEGYCQELKNLHVTDKGTLAVRQSLLGAFASPTALTVHITTTLVFSTTDSVPYYPDSHAQSFQQLTPRATDLPVLIVDGASPVDVINKRRNSSSSSRSRNDNTISPAPAGPYVQYSDRVYYFNSANGVYRVSGWSFTAGVALTTVLIAASPTNPSGYSNLHMFEFKDRLFLVVGNRVYFTETATAGGYPETWDTAANFFDLPVKEIHKVYVQNGIVYFFTPEGVYTLQIYGPPSSWFIKPFDTDVQTMGYFSVAYNKGVFYIIHNKEVYVYNGKQNVKISAPIDSYLEECNGVGVFAFEEGVLVCGQKYIAGSGTSTIMAASRVFYFNNETWSEITLSGHALLSVYDSVVDIISDLTEGRPTSFVKLIYGNEITSSADAVSRVFQTFYVSRKYVSGDSVNISAPALNIDFVVTPVSHSRPVIKEKRIKYGYLNVYSTLSTLYATPSIEGVAQAEQTLTLSGVTDKNYLIKLKMPGFLRRLSVKIRGSVTAAALGVPATTSPIEIKSLHAVLNTHRNEENNDGG